jgi:hypothetical protein
MKTEEGMTALDLTNTPKAVRWLNNVVAGKVTF